MSRAPPPRRARLGLWALILMPAVVVIWIAFKNISTAMPIWSAASDPTLTDKAEPAPSPPSVEVAAEATEAADVSVHEEPAQPVLPPLPAAIAPHRAPASLRQQDHERLQSEADLGAYASELQTRANAGDADAAMTLSDLMGICGIAAEWDAGKAEFADHELNNLRITGMSETQIQQLQSYLLFSGRRCAQWRKQSAEAWWEQSSAWRARAVEFDHPGAYLDARDELVYGSASAETLARARLMGLELLRQRDLEDLTRYADRLAPLSPYDELGFVMASCLLNEDCARDPIAFADSPGATLGLIQATGYSLLNFAGPRARLIAERQAQEIAALWRAGRFELILSGRGSATPEGG
ncbi:MAG: hypothetical protein AB7E72_13790 [Lysobacterales bacterium]